ncbi:insulinase family protein [Chitinivibrio alkaliphilus]|uniref:Peptidase M16C n=1 Tax=Chitinivibrio alkaliphilus ACht1 TaxID=1313304 RepID=U7DCE6_9BACT|nr:insulinase family protein [Chitinivibrio alkaliphilus]ERP32100.1 peptidase M16C [Chitinivibrio alkaliphilus ACht1]
MQEQNIRVGQKIAGFILQDVQTVTEQNSVAYTLTHEKTGAQCIHLFNTDANNLFSVAFKTPVFDDTGVAHILEHSVLAGSKNYPLKDPFKEMLKGSMQTFLNAMTYPDRTVYPVASQVERDYFNLVDVYCDAVFNPLLRENTFRQEGWHFDVPEPDAPVSIKGIVYNEMKGVFSDFHNNVARKMLSGIAPGTTYFHESGGDPKKIPDLTYEQFCDFHGRLYHPSNAYFVLYGNIPTEKTLQFVEDRFLSSYERQDVDTSIGVLAPWNSPRQMDITVPASREDDGYASVLLNWYCPGVLDGYEGLIGDVLSHYLFDGESAPLKRALLDSGLGEDLDDMCGYDNDLFITVFTAGLQRVLPQNSEAVFSCIMKTLQNIADTGPDPELLEGAIRRVEFTLREIREGGGYPHALQVATRIHRSWIYGGDPLTHIAYETPLAQLKKKLAEPGAFSAFIRRFFLDNDHCLRMVAEGSSAMGEQLSRQTEEQATRLSADFTEEDRHRYHEETKALLAEQQRAHTPEELAVLPQLDKSDIPLENELVPCQEERIEGVQMYTHPVFTGGVYYLDWAFDISRIPHNLIPFFPLYASYITKAGAGEYTTAEMAKRLNLVTGGFSCNDTIIEDGEDSDKIHARAVFSGKCLRQNVPALLEVFEDVFLRPDFTDTTLVKNILFQQVNQYAHSIVSAGHSYGIRRGLGQLLPSKQLDEKLNGITQYRFIKKRTETHDYDEILRAFSQIHKALLTRDGLFLSNTCTTPVEDGDMLSRIIRALPESSEETTSLSLLENSSAVAVAVNSSVNYVTQSWKLPHFAPSLVGTSYILARLLSTGLLWDTIRVEGGAYGGMAVFSSAQRGFSLASYRDPNLEDTLTRFVGALKTLAETVTQSDVDRTMFAVVSKFDAPRGPHAKGVSESFARVTGNSPERRQAFRDAVLSCTAEKVSDLCRYLLGSIEQSQVAVIANEESIQKARDTGRAFAVEQL